MTKSKRLSKYARLRVKPKVRVKNPHPQSLAALHRLNRQLYSKRDFDTIRPEWRKWLSFRKWYLSKCKKKGPLTCHFCKHKPLKANTAIVPDRDQATLDHYMPRSAGGKEYDVNNLVVCCRPCNANKADKILS